MYQRFVMFIVFFLPIFLFGQNENQIGKLTGERKDDVKNFFKAYQAVGDEIHQSVISLQEKIDILNDVVKNDIVLLFSMRGLKDRADNLSLELIMLNAIIEAFVLSSDNENVRIRLHGTILYALLIMDNELFNLLNTLESVDGYKEVPHSIKELSKKMFDQFKTMQRPLERLSESFSIN